MCLGANTFSLVTIWMRHKPRNALLWKEGIKLLAGGKKISTQENLSILIHIHTVVSFSKKGTEKDCNSF